MHCTVIYFILEKASLGNKKVTYIPAFKSERIMEEKSCLWLKLFPVHLLHKEFWDSYICKSFGNVVCHWFSYQIDLCTFRHCVHFSYSSQSCHLVASEISKEQVPGENKTDKGKRKNHSSRGIWKADVQKEDVLKSASAWHNFSTESQSFHRVQFFAGSKWWPSIL